MRILIVSATEAEIKPLLVHYKAVHPDKLGLWRSPTSHSHTIDFLVTGIGMINTAYSLGKQLQISSYDWAINLGIAGTYSEVHALASIVRVDTDILAEMGATTADGQFENLQRMGFPLHSYGNKAIYNEIENPNDLQNWNRLAQTPKVRGITVNTVTGNTERILWNRNNFTPDIESMEGGAFALACLRAGQPYVQYRSLSNFVEPRDRSRWKINEAVSALSTFIIQLLEKI